MVKYYEQRTRQEEGHEKETAVNRKGKESGEENQERRHECARELMY
jgi:hypothetical protein